MKSIKARHVIVLALLILSILLSLRNLLAPQSAAPYSGIASALPCLAIAIIYGEEYRRTRRFLHLAIAVAGGACLLWGLYALFAN